MKGRLARWRWVLVGVAVVSVLLSLINASWLAPKPLGRLNLVAMRGVAQRADPAAAGQACAGARIIAEEGNLYIENSLPSLYKALKLGAQTVAIDVQRTSDGQMVVFQDASLDCRTNGKGPVRDHRLGDLKKLDIGHGYTPDGGKTFPLRGRGIGAMPAVEDVLRYIPSGGIIFNFVSGDPSEADALVAAFGRAGAKIDSRYGFAGSPAIAARMRQLAPDAWVYSPAEKSACLDDYVRTGWTSFVPGSCRDTTLILPLDARWKIWGWPYRFFDRMAKAKSKMLIFASANGGAPKALDQPAQYDEVPRSYRGYLFVDDIWTMGPSLQR